VVGANRGGAPGARYQGGRQRDGPQAYGAGTANSFAYFHVEDEASFSLVDNKVGVARRGGPGGPSRGRGGARGALGQRGGTLRGSFRGNSYPSNRPGANARGGVRRPGWRDWDKVRLHFDPDIG
jgi:translation initiation factor 3 subunit D